MLLFSDEVQSVCYKTLRLIVEMKLVLVLHLYARIAFYMTLQ